MEGLANGFAAPMAPARAQLPERRGRLRYYVGMIALRLVVPLPVLPGLTRAQILRFCGVRVGAGTDVRARCVFTTPNVSFGEDCYVNFGVTLDSAASITVGDNVAIAMGATIVTSTHELGCGRARASTACAHPVVIESGCWLGACATVMPGVRIGHGCMIAAGALVTGDCAPDGLYAGVPARRVRDL